MKFYKVFLALNLFLAYTCNCLAGNFDGVELDMSAFLSSNKVMNNKDLGSTAESEEEFFSSNKIYILSKDLCVGDNEILVNMNGNIIAVQCISCDENGLYFQEQAARRVVVYCAKCTRTWVRGEDSPVCPHNRL